MKNEGIIDRGIRLIAGALFLVAAFFWLGEVWSGIAYFLATVAMVTALSGFCPLYRILKINTLGSDGANQKKIAAFFAILFLTILFGGAFASDFFSKKFFIEDFNLMNNDYKQTLFNTGQEKRTESVENYEKLVKSYAVFEAKYLHYRPYAIRKDDAFESDLKKIEAIILGAKEGVYSGDLKKMHLEFEKVRPITQDIFKRNGFSMLAIALVDFHDSMEKVLAKADAKDAAGVIFAYAEASLKLDAVEAEANDSEIQAIRKNLEDILQLAQAGKNEALPAKAAELKSSFVKVYLKRG